MKNSEHLENSLKATRLRLGLSQQHLAEAAGVTRQTIGGIEAGLYAPSAIVALRLAKALGCRVEDLFWLEGQLPTVQAMAAGEPPASVPYRVTLARVENRWIAHPLTGARSFRTEMVPADGIGVRRPGESSVEVTLLDDQENVARTVLIAGCTPALSLWARSAERWYPGLRVHWVHANSLAGLNQLACGEVHLAGVHLWDPETGEMNIPFVQQALPGRAVVLVHVGECEEGLLTAPGNPKKLTSGVDLAQAGIVLVNREEGAGARHLLDSLLQEEKVSLAAVRGYSQIVTTHQEVAGAVQSGKADVGVSFAAMAALYGLGFVPLRRVRYEVALLQETMALEPVQQLIETLHYRWVRSQLRALSGFDTARTGEVRIVPKEKAGLLARSPEVD